MSVRRAALLALLLAAAVAILGSAGPAVATESAIPLQPDEAQALATAPASVPSGSSTSLVDGQTALDASKLPGADTEIEGDISPDAAVGIIAPGGNAISATRPICWAVAAWHQWGTWPYQQRITDTTYWCAVFGSHITFRSSVTTASGTLCGVEWRTNGVIAGGVGRYFTYFTNRASAGFACQTAIPWITLHTSHHEDLKHTDRGVTTFVGTG
ncbi:MAG TPA: hypothetical protein VFV91_10685 [Gaiellaceae bacterium]|jgi:hypothetical protein|nr:hypothetical protein [Gaiellaceae bacterium]